MKEKIGKATEVSFFREDFAPTVEFVQGNLAILEAYNAYKRDVMRVPNAGNEFAQMAAKLKALTKFLGAFPNSDEVNMAEGFTKGAIKAGDFNWHYETMPEGHIEFRAKSMPEMFPFYNVGGCAHAAARRRRLRSCSLTGARAPLNAALTSCRKTMARFCGTRQVAALRAFAPRLAPRSQASRARRRRGSGFTRSCRSRCASISSAPTRSLRFTASRATPSRASTPCCRRGSGTARTACSRCSRRRRSSIPRSNRSFAASLSPLAKCRCQCWCVLNLCCTHFRSSPLCVRASCWRQ